MSDVRRWACNQCGYLESYLTERNGLQLPAYFAPEALSNPPMGPAICQKCGGAWWSEVDATA